MMTEQRKRVRVPDLILKKRRGEKIAMLTAYDACVARILDEAGIDVLLVGDSAGMVVLGHSTTLPVTLDAMLLFTQAVSRAATRALVVADLPFLTYQVTVPEAVRNAGRLVQEGGAAAVKLEGGRPMLDVIDRLVSIGIPVMGHLGLLPQAVHKTGGFRRQALCPADQDRLAEDALAVEKAGAFAVVLECIPHDLSKRITGELHIPTIGIGAGPHCDGQVLVSHDIFGLSPEPVPPFVQQYAALGDAMKKAGSAFAEDVRSGRFPAGSDNGADRRNR